MFGEILIKEVGGGGCLFSNAEVKQGKRAASLHLQRNTAIEIWNYRSN